jgi:glycosyltransferase involved in cell wall biosynthesis
LVYDSHELFVTLHYIPRIERLISRFVERYLIRRVGAVITVNEFAARELSRRYGISLPVVVRNCPPIARQGDEQYNSSLRESLGLDDTVPIIVHVGKFAREEGSEKLVSAVPFLNHGVIVFLGWGAGVEEIYLKELVGRRGLEDRVLFAPPVEPDRVVGHISSAQVGVMPLLDFGLNHYYATPIKLWECISAGLPVVSSNFPALKAIVEGYRLGKTCNPEDPEDIAAAINWVLADEKRYEKMRKNALKAAKIFNWENEARKLLEIYRRLSHRFDYRTA